MRSFASAFTLPSGGNFWNNSSSLSTKSKWSNRLMSSGVIVDAKNPSHIQSLLDGRKLNYTVHNDIKSELIPSTTIENGNSNMQAIGPTLGETTTKQHLFENAFHFTNAVLADFNDYRFVFDKHIQEVYDKGVEGGQEKDEKGKPISPVGKEVSAVTASAAHVPSLFTPNKAVNVIGVSKNIPLYNDVKTYKVLQTHVKGVDVNSKQATEEQRTTVIGENIEDDWTDCSIKTLVALSKEENCRLGAERFKYADFMFCKDLGRISNNYLITLRKFAHPVGDDISCKKGSNAVAPDVARMLCYIGEDNKLDDILKYQYNTTWKELNSKIQEKQSEEDSADRGIIGSIVNLANPNYLKGVAQGRNGSGNAVLGWLTNNTILGSVMSNKGTYEGHEIWGNYDNNKVYTKLNTVQDTHIYEGKLKFSQEFSLVFNYEMRAYDNINPRAAFMDLLANIHTVTYERGSFWGGEQKINGASGNPAGWSKANAFIDQAWDKLGGFCEGLLTGNIDWQSVWGSISNAFGEAGKFVQGAIDGVKDPDKRKETGKTIVRKVKQSGIGEAFKGMLKNKLGRPAMYAFDSLLSGKPVGLHHVTIGNPRAPIISIGNLIITGTTVQHYGPLGIDDFPTGLKVTVNLKHAKSRDLIEIQHMYTGGQGALSTTFNGINKMEEYYDFGVNTNDKTKQVYYASNGEGDSVKLVYENGQWVQYETKPKIGKPQTDENGNVTYEGNGEVENLYPDGKKLGDLANPSATFANLVASHNSAAKTQGGGVMQGTKSNTGYGVNAIMETDVRVRFQTNNIDQILTTASTDSSSLA